ncbi:class I SAM-dependent methyltransferase [Fictibacillus fluitans]|uniref:Class I SAM-dependent methyltransferase n=1 Tax=Fictibacillus fluitans TaxID=3058422 RepID=A0ABT8HSB5_9BACL|nr:class I SAM-dependent methyltransferase [Fictibacillus sp. NE201]MDN4523636.1 class I SAM-dependent methyltransferase [Fictibacillus sp. NE201]
MCIISRDTFFKIFGSGSFIGEGSGFMGSDLEPLISFSRVFRPKTIVEIGIQRGMTAKCLLENSPWIEKYIGIDVTPDHKTTLHIQQNEVPTIPGECVKDDSRVELIVRPHGSRELQPADLPKADLIFIDGDHSEEGVLFDTNLARQIIKKGGIICWHDYGNHLVPGVQTVIDQLNINEGDHICLIENGLLCFQFAI